MDTSSVSVVTPHRFLARSGGSELELDENETLEVKSEMKEIRDGEAYMKTR